MAMFDDPRRALAQLEQELKAAEPRQEEGLDAENYYFPPDMPQEADIYYEEDYRRDYKDRRRKKRRSDGCGGLRFLAALELLAIAAVIGWWILWFSGRL